MREDTTEMRQRREVEVTVSESEIAPRRALYRDLRGALDRGEFVLHYQPILQLSTGRTVGVEALVRWQHPRIGLVQPGRFIELAERSGAVVALGRWVMDEACSQLTRWDREYPELPLDVNVNVSVQQMLSGDFVADTASLLWRRGVDPERVVLEITESFACNEQARRQIDGLKALGVRLAIDDFGTGYSSLSMLRACPFDVLKIDQSFVSGIAHCLRDQQLVHSIIELGHLFGLEVNAEGVEQREQHVVLSTLGCEIGQGYYFGKPLDVLEFGRYMRGTLGALRRSESSRHQTLALTGGEAAPIFGENQNLEPRHQDRRSAMLAEAR